MINLTLMQLALIHYLYIYIQFLKFGETLFYVSMLIFTLWWLYHYLLGNEYSIIVSHCYTTKTITIATMDIGATDYKCHHMNNPFCSNSLEPY